MFVGLVFVERVEMRRIESDCMILTLSEWIGLALEKGGWKWS